jgi:hypothetical protein
MSDYNQPSIHPEYQRRLNGNARGVNLPVTADMLDKEPPPMKVERVLNPSDTMSLEQKRFYNETAERSRYPTRFDVQNTKMKIGGAPMWNRERDAAHKLPSHLPAEDTSFTVPHTPQNSLGEIYGNPRPFDYSSAIRSNHPNAYTLQSADLQRMMRSPDEVDPELVTNPIPDPTFQARQPTFNHAPEDAETFRLRTQRNGPFRFW